MVARTMTRLARLVASVRHPLLVAGLALAIPAAPALTFSHGALSGSFDSTLSVGGLYRLNDPDPRFYGTANGGLAHSVNTDDGNLNYRSGWAAKVLKGTHDLELMYGPNFGAFTRFTYFYDYENADGLRDRTPLSDQARDRVGRRIDYLDLYGLYRFEAGGRPVDVRFGRQVLSLGESTFIPNGNNVVNPVDVSKLRIPGAELREAFLPVNMLKASIGLTDNTALEAFWLLEFRRTEIEPAGTYFSTNDFASRGGNRVYLGFGALSDRNALGAIPRAPDREGNNFSQFGLALRTLAPGLNNTEFGFYYARYHSRVPVLSAFTPTGPVSPAFVQATASSLAQQQLAPAMIAAGYPAAGVPAALTTLLGAALTGVPASALPTTLQPFYPAANQIAGGARQIGLLTAAATGRYFVEYPEDIDMIGVSFNTDVRRLGIAWQGEVSYKQNAPLQVDDVELLFAALSALAPQFGTHNQLGNYWQQYGREIRGFRRHDVWTAQTTGTKVFGPMLRASQLVVVGEVGGVWVNGMPDKRTLRYESPGTFTSGSAAAMVGTGSALPATPLQAFADDFSWGYQVVARLDYNNLFAGINVLPTVAFTHDVKGNTPTPLGNFLEDRKSLNLAAEFVWQNAWSLELRYVDYWGAGRYNLIADRDYFATTFKYSF
jgi:hypothetical protein